MSRSPPVKSEKKPEVKPTAPEVVTIVDEPAVLTTSDLSQQSQLDMEMVKRRERVEKWRSERKLKELEKTKINLEKGTLPDGIPVPNKKWNLEEDSDDDDATTADQAKSKDGGAGGGDDEVDPLDLYMQEVQQEVVKNKGSWSEKKSSSSSSVKTAAENSAAKAPSAESKAQTTATPKPSSVTPTVGRSRAMVIKAVVTKKTAVSSDPVQTKGEVMEQNMDGLEYSSEEEEISLYEANEKLNQKGKKEVIKIDHNKVVYQPFRKNFWVEVPELKAMSNKEVEAYRAEMEGIKVKGKDVAKPLKAWSQAGLSRKMMDVLKKSGYEKPTPIQAQAIPVVLSGRDMIGIAKTGSGKTLAFVLPMIRHVVDQPPLSDNDGPISIIMAPTRELCLQIGKECRKFAKHLGLRVVCVYGGTGISEQIAELKRGAEVIVCTPGRMIDMLAANSGRVTNLTRVTYIVLDEADRMFDMGFEPQVMRVIDNVRPDRQCVLFSATFPRQMEALARRMLLRPVEIQVGGRSVVCKDVEQHVIILDENLKFFKLLELLGQYLSQGSAIIFVDKQEAADDLLRDLINASYPCMALHGAVDQYDRDSVITDFKNGKVRLLVATSVAARGLDVKHLILVVNYDCPNHYEDYVHRCGRTGRAGNHGYAYTFVTEDRPKPAGDIIKALELSETAVPDNLKQLWERYKQEQALAGKTVKLGGGFGGRGFKFDDSESQLQSDKKKYEKAALGLQDSDDDDNDDDIDQKIESLLASKRTVKEIKAGSNPASAASLLNNKNDQTGMASTATTSSSNNTSLLGAPPTTSMQTVLNTVNPLLSMLPNMMAAAAAGNVATDKLQIARQMAMKVSAAKMSASVSSDQQTTEAILKGGVATQPVITSKMVAEQLAAKLNNRLNYIPEVDRQAMWQEEEEEEEQAPPPPRVICKYEEELDINDFPQRTRWKITSKETLSQISEYSEAGITVRGTYFAPNSKVPDGERKLYLAIESTSDMAVSRAKAEITRLIKEELIKAQNAPVSQVNRGRYKVI